MAIDGNQVVQAVVGWSRETLPDLLGEYTYTPAGKTEQLPDVVADVGTIEYLMEDARFPMLGFEQVLLAVYSVGLSIMVDNADPESAAIQLRGMAEQLAASLLADVTLGGRVPIASPIMTFDFTRPHVEYSDGTRGRELTVELVIGVPLTGEQEPPT